MNIKKNRCLLYYEDLIVEPEAVLRYIADNLNIHNHNIPSFMEDIEHHKKKCIEIYTADSRKPKTNGSDVIFHSNSLSKKNLKKIDGFLDKEYSYLYNKYLTRYSE